MKISKLILTIASFFSLVLGFLNSATLVQAFTEEYLTKRDYYLKWHQEYIAARQTYLNYQTLQTKENLIKKLREFLIARNEFLRAYLLVLLSEGKPFLPESDFVEIRSWIAWLDQETRQIGSIGSLEKLLVFADHLKEKYPEIEKEIFVFLTKLTIGQQNDIIKKIEQLMVEIRSNLNESSQNSESIFHWLEEIAGQLTSIREKQQLALETIEKARIGKIGMTKISWQKSKKLLVEANFQLKEVVGFLDEIIVTLGE